MTAMTLDKDPYVSNHPQARPFWDAAATGVLLLPHCCNCDRAHWYPRPFCPHCYSDAVTWQPASGLGTVYAFTALRRVMPVNIVAYVRLAEGPMMLTNVIGCSLDDLLIEATVCAIFRPTKEGRMVPVFKLVASREASGAVAS